MKILYLLKQDPDDTLNIFMNTHRWDHEVNVIDIRIDTNYSQIVELIEKSDKVISW
jgi:hypothetical protein